jgi:N-acyl homoserine lactone hydrolase
VFIWTIDHPAGRVLADARSRDDYTIREWVDIRLLPAPSHSDGHQIVVVESDAGTTVIAG